MTIQNQLPVVPPVNDGAEEGNRTLVSRLGGDVSRAIIRNRQFWLTTPP